jgi:hypothetical protein
VRHVLIFVMLDTSQIVTPFNLLWSHNVAHNCDHATRNVDCCYDILQHLLRVCTKTKTSVKFQAIYHLTSSTCRNILRLLTYNQKYLASSSDNAVVSCGDVKFTPTIRRTLLPSHKFGCCLKIRSSEYDLIIFILNFTNAINRFCLWGGGDGPLALITRWPKI